MYIEHKNRSLVICLFSFIKCRKGILHRKLSVKSMVVEKKMLECDDPPQLPASSIFCSRSSLCAARMQKKLFVYGNASVQNEQSTVIFNKLSRLQMFDFIS